MKLFSTSPVARRNRVRLGVQSLEAREVPATVLNLTTVGASVNASGAIVQQTAATTDPAQFDTFLRLDASGNEKGYNTDFRPFQYDQKGDLTVTHSLLLADVPIVNIDGTDYREFYLHVRETAQAPFITLDELRFYVAEAGNLRNYRPANDTLGGQTAVFNLDAADNFSVRLDDRLNGTTGKGDAFVYIPSSVFGNATYVYLYSKFGGPNNANGGAEEWGVRPVEPPPPPATGSISGFVFGDIVGGVGGDGIFTPPDEPGINDVTMRLEREVSTDVWEFVADTVTTTTVVDDVVIDGFYSFTNLTAGSYRVTRVDEGLFPDDVFNGFNHVGSVDGVENVGNDDNPGIGDDPPAVDSISGIVLGVGSTGIDYNFGMLPQGPPN